MHTLTLQNATQLTQKSESTIRRDVKKGKVSATRDAKGHLRFDKAELMRAYGELHSTGNAAQSRDNDNGSAMTRKPDSAEILALKDNQIADLRSQLDKAEQRENRLIEERGKLLDIVSRQTEMILPGETPGQPKNWVSRLLGIA